MRIALVTVGEPLPIGDGVRERPLRTGYFSRILADHGHDVTWWTSAFDHSHKRKIATGAARFSICRGLEIRTLDGGGYARNVSLARLRDHRALAKAFAAAIRREECPDVVLSSFPPIELGLAAVEYGRQARVPVALDMRDMWPDIFVEEFPSWCRPVGRLVLTPFFRQTERACRGATAITGITAELMRWGLQHGGRAAGEFDQAFPLGYATRKPPTERIAAAESFWTTHGVPATSTVRTICFFGSMGRQFDLDTVIGAAHQLAARGVPVRFVLCGNGERLDRYRQLAAGLPNVTLPGWMDEAQIYVLLRRSYAGVDPLPDRRDYLASINNKAIEYLSAGVPVLSSPAKGVLADALAEWDCGASCPDRDPEALAALVERACDHPDEWARKAENAAAFFEKELAAEKVYGRFEQYLQALVTRYSSASTAVTTAAPPVGMEDAARAD